MGSEGIKEDVWIPTSCSICYGGCSIKAHRVDGTVVKIEGNPESPIGSGKICAKGLAGMMLLYDPNRLNVPLRRTNPEKGIGVDPQWQEISWEEALEEISARLKKILREDPRQLFVQATTTVAPASLFFFTFGWAFGSPNLWVAGGGLHCGNGAHAIGGIMHASWSLVPDFRYCKYALYFGASKGHGAGHASTATVLQAADARAAGMKMVVVDPMCNFAAAKATEWVPIRVGTDAALALAMINVLLNELGIYDADYLKTKTNGPYLIRPDGLYARHPESGQPLVWDATAKMPKPYNDPALGDVALLGAYQVNGAPCKPSFALLKEHVAKHTPEWAEGITTVPADTIRRLAREFGEAAQVGSTIVVQGVTVPYRPVAAIYFRGAQGHKNSSHNCFAIDLLNQLVGAADVVGGALGFNPACHGHPQTGRPAYRPLAEVDGLMTPGVWMLPHVPYPPAEPRHPDSMGFTELFPLSHVSPLMGSADQEKIWNAFDLPYRPQVLLNYGANSLMSVGNRETLAASLKKIPFIVSFDLFLNEFSDFADIVLPDVCYLEMLEASPNFPFIFNHPAGLGEWCWAIRQPVVEPRHQRRPARQVLLELADRVGIREELNMAINVYYNLDGPEMLEPRQRYSFEEITDRVLRHKFGPERGLAWFKEHGLIKWPKQPQEVYWRPFEDVRIPIYWEFLQSLGEKTRAIAEPRGLIIDKRYYSPLPEWLPCPSHETNGAYDLFAFYYRDALHTNSFTMENAWLDEASQMDPYTYRVCLHSETARRRGIADGDEVWIESAAGRKISGKVCVSEGIHPEGVGIAACAGHWGAHQPIARGKGLFFNDLLEVDFTHSSPVNLNMDVCAKVRVYK